MNRILGVILLAGGIVLLVMGVQASDSVASSFSRLFNGSPTDKAIWLLLGGAVAAGLGIVVMTRRTPASA